MADRWEEVNGSKQTPDDGARHSQGRNGISEPSGWPIAGLSLLSSPCPALIPFLSLDLLEAESVVPGGGEKDIVLGLMLWKPPCIYT